MKYRLLIEPDLDFPNPEDRLDWKVIPFDNNKINYDPIDNYVRELPFRNCNTYAAAHPGLIMKFNGNLAFWLKNFGDEYVIICEGDKTDKRPAAVLLSTKTLRRRSKEQRRESADDFMELFNAWKNGSAFRFCLSSDRGNPVRWNNGITKLDFIIESCNTVLTPEDTVEVVGEHAWILNQSSLNCEWGHLSERELIGRFMKGWV